MYTNASCRHSFFSLSSSRRRRSVLIFIGRLKWLFLLYLNWYNFDAGFCCCHTRCYCCHFIILCFCLWYELRGALTQSHINSIFKSLLDKNGNESSLTTTTITAVNSLVRSPAHSLTHSVTKTISFFSAVQKCLDF